MATKKNYNIVLVGGGLCNCLLMKFFKDIQLKKNDYNFSVTLISENQHTFYSGMLPNLLTNLYTLEDISIELKALATWTHCNYIFRSVVQILPKENKLILNDNSFFFYDVLVVNIGGYTKGINKVIGAQQYSIATRPVMTSIEKIEQFEREFKINGIIPTLVVVGGGLAGMEFAFGMQTRWSEYFKLRSIKVTIIHEKDCILAEKQGATMLSELLRERGIKIVFNAHVQEIKRDCVIYKDIINQKLYQIPTSVTILATGAECSSLFYTSGLETDDMGFLVVNNYMQSREYNNIFGAGDCVQLHKYLGTNFPPKAGMYSIAEGPVIGENIVSLMEGKENNFTIFKPQATFLIIENICNKREFYGKWVAQMKDYMDRGLMRLFSFKHLFSRYDQFCSVKNEDQLTRSNYNEFDNLNLEKQKERALRRTPKEVAMIISLVNQNSKCWEEQWFIFEKMEDDLEYRNLVIKEVNEMDNEFRLKNHTSIAAPHKEKLHASQVGK